MSTVTVDNVEGFSVRVFRKHPVRLLWWFLAEWGVNTLLALQDSIESKNRASVVCAAAGHDD